MNMSMSDLMAMLDCIPKIKSMERLEAISDHAVASGNMKKQNVNRHLRRLQRQAYYTRPATTQDLSAAGIKVIRG